MITPEALITVAWIFLFLGCFSFFYLFKPTARIIRKFIPQIYEGYKDF